MVYKNLKSETLINISINNKEGELVIIGKQVAEGYYKNYIDNKKFKIINGKKAYFTGDVIYKFRNWFTNRYYI